MSTFWNKIKNHSVSQSLYSLLVNTRVEIFIGLFAVSTFVGVFSYRDNKKKEAQMPVAPSEIEIITQKFKAQGKSVPFLTQEYAVSNDMVMNVFASNNEALAKDESNATFARELEKRKDQLDNYTGNMKTITQGALRSLHKPRNASKNMASIVDAFNKAWTDHHRDVNRIIMVPVTRCSSSGKTTTCSTTLQPRSVYDHTVHTYTFDRAQAELAMRLLNDMLDKNPDLNIGESLVRTTETSAENEKAILSSMIAKFKDKKPTAKDYLEIANTFVTGSTFAKHFPEMVKGHSGLKWLADDWASAVNTAQSTTYKTTRRSDAGPREFQLAEEAIAYGIKLSKGTKAVTDGILFAGQKVPELDAKIQKFIDVSLHGKEGDADALRKEVMQTARDIYTKNFENGFDVYPFKWGTIILLTLAGAVIGAAAGAGADRWLNKYEEKRLARKALDDHTQKRNKIKDLFF